MKIICCIKPVPDPASRLAINESRTWIKTQDLTFVASEADNYALEEALQLKERAGGEAIAISLGADESAKVLRAALAMGADRAVHLTVGSTRSSTEFDTAQALAGAIEKDGGATLVLTGVQSDDLGTGATGIMIAEFLGWPHASIVVGVDDVTDTAITVRRELEGGVIETVELPLPAVLTIQFGANQPRYASLKGIMAAKKKPFLTEAVAPVEGTPQQAMYDIKEIAVPEKKGRVEFLSGTPEEAVTRLVEKLRKEAKVL